jgi:eukaryotic-like serine/threonine-protein kinase
VSWKAVLHGEAEPPEHQHDHADPLDLHLEIMQDVCNAVEFAHSRGIIHRDLKPENVMIGAFGEVYLLDWGVAVSLEDDGSGRLPLASEVDHIAGTPSYLAPEMTEAGLAPITPATDVYLLGAVLHEVLTGAPPHQGDSLYSVLFAAHASEPPRFGDDVPVELGAICRRAMSRDPADRFPSVRDFHAAIAEYLRHRASYVASDEALGVFAELERVLDSGGEVDHERAYELLGQCRFGFQQALRIHDGNVGARDGLQAVLERMVDYELERGAHGAAQALIDQMPRPDQVAQERRAALEQLLAEKRREVEQLRQLRQDLDLNVGSRSRIRYVLALGVFWGFLSMSTGVTIRLGLFTPSTLDMLTPNVLFLGALGIAALVWRKSLFGNVANQRLVLAFMLMFVGASALGIVAIWQQQTVQEIVVGDMVVMFLVTAMIAISIDARLAVVAGLYFVAILVCGAYSQYAFEIAGAVDLVAMSLLALLWRPRQEPEGEAG